MRRRGDPAPGRHRGGDLPPPGALRDPDGTAHRVVPVPRPAGVGARHRIPRRGDPADRQGHRAARARGQVMDGFDETLLLMRHSSDETQCRGTGQDAQGGSGGGGDPRGHPGGHPSRRVDRRARPGGPGGARPARRRIQFPQLPRLSRRGVHVTQLDDRPRHPLSDGHPGGGGHHLGGLRGDHRGLPRRRRLHRRRWGRSPRRRPG